MAFHPTYVNLNPIENAQLQRRANQQSPLDALLAGAQQGLTLGRLPQTLQDQELARQLNNALMTQKLNDLQNPQQALARKIQEELTIKGALNPDLGIVRAEPGLVGQTIANPGAITEAQQAALPSPELMAMRQTALDQGGVTSPASIIPTAPAAAPERPISAFGIQTGLNSNPNIPAQAAADKLDRQIRLLNARPETYGTIMSDQGIFRVGNRTNDLIPLNAQSGNQLASIPKVGNQPKITRFSDAQGNLFQQSTSGGAATPVLDANENPINVGIPNRVFETDQGPMSVPTKGIGSPVATPVITGTGERLTKTSSNPLSEKLAKDVQSNKSYQAYRTVADAMDGLQATLDYANSNPSDQTGIKSSAVDAFNKIVNPGSIVRQQAFAQTTSGQSLINKAESLFQGIISGQTITPEQIQSMLNIAQKYEEGARASAERELSVIKNRGDKAGIATSDYLPDLFTNKSTNSSMTRIMTPNGQELDIPTENLGEALKRGAKVK